jgi:hypothetical protein
LAGARRRTAAARADRTEVRVLMKIGLVSASMGILKEEITSRPRRC